MGAARSGQRTVYAPAGRETRLVYYAAPRPDCGAGPDPEIAIVEKPSYGKIVLRLDRILARPSSLPARSAACAGKFFDMAGVFYRPSPHFRGSDRVVLRIKFPAWPDGRTSTLEEEIFISVR